MYLARRLFLCCCFASLLALAAPTPASAQCGVRLVSPTGSNAPGNTCLTTPCGSINQAIGAACAGDAIAVGEGLYVESVVVTKNVYIDSSGNNANTKLRGDGGPAIALLANGAQLNGFTVIGPAQQTCVQIGDAAHPNVRSVQVTNSNISGCRVGIAIDSVGTVGDWIRINGNIIGPAVSDGSADSGIGVLVTGTAGRVQVRQNTISSNDGAGIKVAAGTHGTVEISGCTMASNGLGPAADTRAAIEVHGGVDVHVEGNAITNTKGLGAVDDGRGIWIDGGTTGQVVCNQVTGSDGGLRVTGSFVKLEVLQNRFASNTGPGIEVGPGGATGVRYGENLLLNNGGGFTSTDVNTVDAQHNWWGKPDGPSGAGGTGDPVSGLVNTGNFIPRTLEPVLARAPYAAGWSKGAGAACYDTLQPAIDGNPTGGLILLGQGEIRGRSVITRAMDIEGVPGYMPYEWCDHCAPAVVDGTQYTEPRKPALQVLNVSGISLKYLTFHGAGMGTPACFGGHQDTEIGLDLQNVSNSRFENLVFRENGTTDLRLWGNSDDNLLSAIQLDGMIRDGDNEDRCGHRSREGILVDGGPRVCEGGAGALAERNRIVAPETYHITRSIKLRYADDTEITGGKIHGVPSDEWPEPYTVNIWVEASHDTHVHDVPEISNRGVLQAIHLVGSLSCEPRDTARTTIDNVTVSMIDNSGTGLRQVHSGTENGSVIDTHVTCSTIKGAALGVWVDEPAGAQLNLLDVVQDTNGVRNDGAGLLTVNRTWWGDPSGPSGQGPGTGTSIGVGVDATAPLASSAFDDADGDGYTECAGDVDDTNPLLMPHDPCDGFDNDQDGTIDEDFVSSALVCGQGPCRATGSTACEAGVVVNHCTPGDPLAPNDVTCDNVDDDCDGTLDEDYGSTPTNCGIGGCARTGAITCVNGSVSNTCVPGTPAAADLVCNALDEDCDGQTDEDYVSRATTCGVGVCASTGATSCAGGVEQDSCAPLPPALPADTACNGADDDCDGTVDEDYVPTTQTCGDGVCRHTTTSSCVAGHETGACVPFPPQLAIDFTCNGIDEDCDGSVDEDFEPQLTTCGVGVCGRLGYFQCRNGAIVNECVPGPPGVEVCNGQDDDCDGTIDNVAAPHAVDGLLLDWTGQSVKLDWTAANAPNYDVVRGDVGLLLAAAGDFAAAIEVCQQNNYGATSFFDPSPGPDPGAIRFYLVRAQNCGPRGTYDDANPIGLAAPRDPSIANSPNACP